MTEANKRRIRPIPLERRIALTEVDPLSEEGIAATDDALRRRWQVPAGGKVTLITGTFSDPKLSQWFAQWFEGGDQHV